MSVDWTKPIEVVTCVANRVLPAELLGKWVARGVTRYVVKVPDWDVDGDDYLDEDVSAAGAAGGFIVRNIPEPKYRPLTKDELALSGATHARRKRDGAIGTVFVSAREGQFAVLGLRVTPTQALADYELGWPGRGWGPFGVEVERATVERATVIRKKAEPFGIE